MISPIPILCHEVGIMSPSLFKQYVNQRLHSLISCCAFHEASRSPISVMDLFLAPHADLLAIADRSTLRVCQVNGHVCSQVRNPFKNSCMISGVQWYPVDPGVAIISDVSGYVRIIDMNFQRTANNISLGTELSCSHLSISPLNHTVASVCLSGQNGIRLVDIRTGGHSQILSDTRRQHKCICSEWSPADPHVCISGHSDQTISIWDIRRPSPLHVIQPPVRDHVRPISALKISPFGSHVFAASNGRLSGWRIDDGGRPTLSHQFTIPLSKKRTQFEISSRGQSILFPDKSDLKLIDMTKRTSPRTVKCSLGTMHSVISNKRTQTIYTGDAYGVISVLQPMFPSTDPLPNIDWDDVTDPSDVEYPG
uniref:Anaphase-promoting complex subunit 4 WD40 domain-containing protein n=1 Tax=Spongospora subterranea TaxID=70186 RepID=A0A0H5RQX2_9EUKA|eukprot:CRZ11119.1 hypothetical protein [Spongospora subterranea]